MQTATCPRHHQQNVEKRNDIIAPIKKREWGVLLVCWQIRNSSDAQSKMYAQTMGGSNSVSSHSQLQNFSPPSCV